MTPDKVEEMKLEITRCVLEAWREHRSVTGAVNEIMELLTQYHQDLMSEIEKIDFYGWDENTQRMIREKIINLSK